MMTLPELFIQTSWQRNSGLQRTMIALDTLSALIEYIAANEAYREIASSEEALRCETMGDDELAAYKRYEAARAVLGLK